MSKAPFIKRTEHALQNFTGDKNQSRVFYSHIPPSEDDLYSKKKKKTIVSKRNFVKQLTSRYISLKSGDLKQEFKIFAEIAI